MKEAMAHSVSLRLLSSSNRVFDANDDDGCWVAGSQEGHKSQVRQQKGYAVLSTIGYEDIRVIARGSICLF
jgi:hypothetical protein